MPLNAGEIWSWKHIDPSGAADHENSTGVTPGVKNCDSNGAKKIGIKKVDSIGVTRGVENGDSISQTVCMSGSKTLTRPVYVKFRAAAFFLGINKFVFFG